jgi:hypothetical protein
MALPEVTKLSALLLTIPTTSTSVMQSFSVLKRACAYLHSMQTKERFTKLTLMTNENSLRHANIPNFYNSVIDTFMEKNCPMGPKYKL